MSNINDHSDQNKIKPNRPNITRQFSESLHEVNEGYEIDYNNNIPFCYPYYMKKVQMLSGKVVYEKCYDPKVQSTGFKKTLGSRGTYGY